MCTVVIVEHGLIVFEKQGCLGTECPSKSSLSLHKYLIKSSDVSDIYVTMNYSNVPKSLKKYFFCFHKFGCPPVNSETHALISKVFFEVFQELLCKNTPEQKLL